MMFAHNNNEINYFRLSVVNALLIQKFLNLSAEQITVVTDSHSLEFNQKALGKELISRAIGNIIINEKDIDFKINNQRVFKDTSQHALTLSFYNKNRCDAYDLSPYDETILIDADYLILSDSLNHCWDHNNDIMMNHEFQDVLGSRDFPGLDRIGPASINMYWATVVYFRKTPYAKTVFDVCKHVLEHKDYYGNLYRWKGSVFRNDYSFSIAAHMTSGFTHTSIPQLPIKIYKTFDNDDIHSVDDDLNFILYLEKPNSPGDFMLTRWKNLDIHIMNNWALNRISDKVLEVLDAA